jgi:hypothetical protein
MKRLWTVAELAEHWTLLPDELALLGNKTGATRLGFALLLKACQLEGRFPAGKHDLSGAVVAHLARQVNVPALAFLEYDGPGTGTRRVMAHLLTSSPAYRTHLNKLPTSDPPGFGVRIAPGARRRGAYSRGGIQSARARNTAPCRCCHPPAVP